MNESDQKRILEWAADTSVTSADFERMMLESYRLTTAEIIYHMPDHPSVLQSYVWQEVDKNPTFPELHKFLNFWERELDGALHSVQVASCEVITPSEYTHQSGIFTVH